MKDACSHDPASSHVIPRTGDGDDVVGESGVRADVPVLSYHLQHDAVCSDVLSDGTVVGLLLERRVFIVLILQEWGSGSGLMNLLCGVTDMD